MRILLTVLFLICNWTGTVAAEPEKVGVLLMHGKQGGGPRDNSLDTLNKKLKEQGWIVLKPEMPWSFNRFIDGDWNLAMSEMDAHVRTLKEMGAKKILVMGHSLGSPAAMSYAVRHPGQVHALALLAPGHVPYYYSLCIPYSPIRMCGVKDGVEQARKEVDAGNGDKRLSMVDINQGRRNPVWMTPRSYLSYYDPTSDA
jgi:pimeloyl-ACP methyl ester carboxylesterase